MTELEKAVEQYVASQLKAHEPRSDRLRSKIIHDALWGTLHLSPAEVEILDCPLVQRLRSIHQTALAFYTFPSARHSRIEHSLGCMAMANRMAEAVNAKALGQEGPVSPPDLQTLRLAGLLHDIGHGFFSHISEDTYKQHKWIQEFKEDPDFAHAAPHEILGYTMVLSSSFFTFFKKVQGRHKTHDLIFAGVKVEEIARLILGLCPTKNTREKKYLADIINGPFDADKLDYIARDAYFTGLPLSVDIERILHALTVKWTDEEGSTGNLQRSQKLVSTVTGASALEYMLVSKLRLYHSLYHHPKVRAADRMMGNIVRYMSRMRGVLSGPPTVDQHTPETAGAAAAPRMLSREQLIVLDNPVAYLEYVDGDFMCPASHRDPNLLRMIEALRKRYLPVKALVISERTVKTGMLMINGWVFDKEGAEIGHKLAQRIYERMPTDVVRGYVLEDIIVDLPDVPELNEAKLTKVVCKDENGEEYFESLDDQSQIRDWLDTSIMNKWRGHVFSPAALQSAANEAAIEVFKEPDFGIEFRPLATILANMRD